MASQVLVIGELVGVSAALVTTEASQANGQARFGAASLFPKFAPNPHDYVVRCRNRPVTVRAHVPRGWEAAIGDHPYRRGDFSEVVPLVAGQGFIIAVRHVGRTQ